jgi:hypothetical protein
MRDIALLIGLGNAANMAILVDTYGEFIAKVMDYSDTRISW